MSLFILKRVILDPRDYIFLNPLQGSGMDPVLYTGWGCCWRSGSPLKGCRGKVDHRPSETVIIISGWDADVSEKQQGCCCQTKPNLSANWGIAMTVSNTGHIKYWISQAIAKPLPPFIWSPDPIQSLMQYVFTSRGAFLIPIESRFPF